MQYFNFFFFFAKQPQWNACQVSFLFCVHWKKALFLFQGTCQVWRHGAPGDADWTRWRLRLWIFKWGKKGDYNHNYWHEPLACHWHFPLGLYWASRQQRFILDVYLESVFCHHRAPGGWIWWHAVLPLHHCWNPRRGRQPRSARPLRHGTKFPHFLLAWAAQMEGRAKHLFNFLDIRLEGYVLISSFVLCGGTTTCYHRDKSVLN